MIVDYIKNIRKYSNLIPQDVLTFIENLNNDIEIKRHIFKNENYANVDVYSPKPIQDCRFEAHKNYIDVQIMLKGEEEIDITSVDSLEILEQYDENRDVMFFYTHKKPFDKIILSEGKFVLIYPYEAHQPQVKTTCDNVKKVVCKIKC